MMAYFSEDFAETLGLLGHGRALWFGEEPVQLGDVGFFAAGSFHRIFNTVHPQGVQNDCGTPQSSRAHVPKNFEPFRYDKTADVQQTKVSECECTVNVERVKNAATQLPSGTGMTSSTNPELPAKFLGHQYQCIGDSGDGAMLLFDGGATTTTLICDAEIRQYVLKYIPEWTSFATTKSGTKLKVDDLIFVSGYTAISATQPIACVAVHNAQHGDILSFRRSWNSASMFHVHTEPTPGRSKSTKPLSVSERVIPCPAASKEYNTSSERCIFLHYYSVTAGRHFRRRVVRKVPEPNRLFPDPLSTGNVHSDGLGHPIGDDCDVQSELAASRGSQGVDAGDAACGTGSKQ